jgi:hypothetical protein
LQKSLGMIAPSDYETRYRLRRVIHLFQSRKRGEYLFHHLRHLAVSSGLRLLLVRGYTTLNEIQDDDLKQFSTHYSKGIDVLDAALCALGIFARSPKHGSTRHSRRRPLTITELVGVARTPAPFRDVLPASATPTRRAEVRRSPSLISGASSRNGTPR